MSACPATSSGGGGLTRRQPHFHPVWGNDSVYTRFARSFAWKNQWRVSRQCPTVEDAIQEAAFVFAKCVDQYVTNPRPSEEYRQVDNPAWFMALYRNALFNHWNGLSRKCSRSTDLEQASDDTDTPAPASMWDAIAQVSDELKAVMGILVTAPEATLEVIWRELSDPECRWSLNTKLRRMAKLPMGVDLVRELRSLL